MTDVIGYAVEQGVAFLSLTAPPGNALTRGLRAALMEMIDRAEEDPTVQEIALIGAGYGFSSGADMGEYQTGFAEPALRDLCARLDFAEKPVVAALAGKVSGAGLELALAAHCRIAARDAHLALPEIRLGLPPMAGGSQRLPRLAGAKLALEMLVGARGLSALAPDARRLLDGLSQGDLRRDVVQFCRQLRAAETPPMPSRDRRAGFEDMAAYQEQIATARDRIAGSEESAARRILALVEAAPLVPFEAGLAMEEDAFTECLASDSAQALRHAFFAERDARRFGGADLPTVPSIERIALLGGGALAVQIAAAALNAGLAVNWGTRDAAAREDGVAQLRQLFAQIVPIGEDAGDRVETRMAKLRTGDSAAMVEGADMILHAARGQGDVPAPPHLVRAVAMQARVDALGLRFAPPVFATRLVEIIHGPEADPRQIATALALADRLKKLPVHVTSTGSSLAGSLMAALHRAADALVDLGADPYAVDRAVQAWGWQAPPFQTRDVMGLAEFGQAERADGAQNWSAAMVQEGRSGRSAGAGFYNWSQGGASEDPAVQAHLDAIRKPQPMSDSRIITLLLGAMANEGTRMLDRGMARRASDLDVVAMLGLKFPRDRGGPMKAVSLRGLFPVATDMTRMGHPDTAFWTPEPVWHELIKNGRSFDAL